MFKIRNTAGMGRLLGLALFAAVTTGRSDSDQLIIDIPEPTVAERLQAVLEQAVADGLPGAALAIKSDRFEFNGVAGVEDTTTAVPLTVNHRFYLASVGKTYTAVAALRMASDGLLNLEDPITMWLPASITDRIPSSDVISIRTLLNHTSGIFDYSNDSDDFDDDFLVDPARHWTNSDVLPYFLDRPLHFEPTTDYRYSNSNYVLVALILEAASGLSIQELIRYHIVEPLGLQDTVHGDDAAGLPGLVHGYVDADGDIIDVHPWLSHYGLSDGGIQASAEDIVEFVREAVTGSILLDDAIRAEFLTPSGIGDPASIYGLGIEIIAGAMPKSFAYQHAGKNPGARADFVHMTSGSESITIAWCGSGAFGDYDPRYEEMVWSAIEVLGEAGELPDA